MENPANWESWLDQHGPSLVLLARRLCRAPADAEDVVQEAFVRFWRTRDSVREPVSYLYRCVRNCAYDLQRKRVRTPRREADLDAEAGPALEPWFESDQADELELREVQAALELLPAEQAETLIMKIWGGLTFEQIAAAMEVPAATAASRYRYGLRTLRRKFCEEEQA